MLAPAAWEAWGRGNREAKDDRSSEEPERTMALERGAPPETASTRAHILDTAERQFAEQGFAGVTMRHIAVDAGLRNQASLYHHFRDKRALYEAALARGVEPIIALLVESAHAAPLAAAAGGTARRHAVETILDRLLDYLAEHPHLPRLIHRAVLDDSRHLRETIPDLLAPFYDAGLSALAGSSAQWEANDLPHVAFGIYHLIFGYFANAPLLEVVLPGDPLSPPEIARHRRFIKVAVAQLLGVAVET